MNIIPCAHGKIHSRSEHTTHRILTICITDILEGDSRWHRQRSALNYTSPRPESTDARRRGDHKISKHPTHEPRYNNVQNPKSCLMIAFSLSTP